MLMGNRYLRSSRFVARYAINVAVVVASAGDVAGFAHVPGNIGLDGEEEGKEKRNVGKLHCSTLLIFNRVKV
jgi:hypothetical protein